MALSFDKKVTYFKKWKFAFLSALIIAIPFLIWDEIFTQNGFWGFNPDYLVGIYLGSLPLEEVLFFIVVPFACLFIYECVKYYFRNMNLRKANLIIYLGLFVFSVWIFLVGFNAWYSLCALSLGLILVIVMFLKREQYKFFPLSFLLALIPFFVINGILTGSFLDAPIVWYNEAEFSGIRFFTIPAEDLIYAWDLLVLNVFIFDYLIKKSRRSINEEP